MIPAEAHGVRQVALLEAELRQSQDALRKAAEEQAATNAAKEQVRVPV